MGLTVKDIAVGDVFSEGPHYKSLAKKVGHVEMLHLETGKVVTLANDYVEGFLQSADQVDSVVKVGKEDKLWTALQIAAELQKEGKGKASEIKAADGVRVGDLRSKGIRTIFKEIYTHQVFTLVFQKQDTKKTIKEYEAQLLAQQEQIATELEALAKEDKGIAAFKAGALGVVAKVQKNYISPITPGEDRTLRGFKIEFESRDGKYNCVDMDIDPKLNNVRPVNINTIKSLSYNGVQYVVE